MLSVIYSCHNEERNDFFRKGLGQLRSLAGALGLEVICVVGGSTDGTKSLILEHGFTCHEGDERSRGKRFDQGLALSTAPMVLFHHPRSLISPEGITYLARNASTLEWGAFTHRFDHPHPALRFTSWYSNHVRGDLKSIYYLDHCLFAKRDLLNKIGGFPHAEIFEDTEACRRLRLLCRPVRLPHPSTTSAVRFLSNGILRQSFLNFRLKLRYAVGGNRTEMNETYEKNLNLNSKAKNE